MKYFIGIEKDLKACKVRYKQWCKVLHPDSGGNDKEFQDMQNEYDFLLKPKTTKQKVTQSDNMQNNAYDQTKDFINLASNLIGLVKTSIGLAREINTMLELEHELNNIKENKNEN